MNHVAAADPKPDLTTASRTRQTSYQYCHYTTQFEFKYQEFFIYL